MFQLKLESSHICQFTKHPMCCEKCLKDKQNSLALEKLFLRTNYVGGQISEYSFAQIEVNPLH